MHPSHVICLLQGVAQFSCGSSCWSSLLTSLASISSAGQVMAGSSSCLTQMKWHADGASAKTSQRWTTKNSPVGCGTITTRTSSTKQQASATSIALCVTSTAFWVSHLKSSSKLAMWSHRRTRKRTEVLVKDPAWIQLLLQPIRTHCLVVWKALTTLSTIELPPILDLVRHNSLVRGGYVWLTRSSLCWKGVTEKGEDKDNGRLLFSFFKDRKVQKGTHFSTVQDGMCFACLWNCEKYLGFTYGLLPLIS